MITKKYVLSSGAVSWYSDKQPLKTSSSFELRARVIVGVDDNVLQYLPSDDDNFFGTPAISSDRSSSEDESSLQLSTKVPRVDDS